MPRHRIVWACASAILLVAAGTCFGVTARASDSVAPGYVPPSAANAPPPAPAAPPPLPAAPKSALILPPEPALASVTAPSPPVSFCSETDRVRYLTEVFNPAAEAATANATAAANHLADISQAIVNATAPSDIIAGHQAYDAYRPKADQWYKLGMAIQTIRPAIMSVPIAACGAPPDQDIASAPALPAAPPSPPRAMAYESGSPPRAYFAPVATQPGQPSAPTGRFMPGPKRTVAVGALQASGGFTNDENWRAGPALSAMLTKTLADTGRFVVVDRNALGDVLNEQALRATHVAGGTTSGPPVKMIPAQYLVEGAVTEFGSPNTGGGLSIGGLGSNGLGGGLGLTHDTGRISIDFQIVSPRTGEVIDTFTITRSVSHTGVALNLDYNGVAVGGNEFSKTPLGEASRQAMVEAAQRIVDFVAQGNWEGRVVDFDGVNMDTIVNAGSEAGLLPGDRLRVERMGRTLTDPDTGQVLSERHDTLGEVVISATEAKIANGRFTAFQPGIEPQRGDLVIFVTGQQP